MVSLEFFIDIILPAALWPLGSTQPLTEREPGIFPGGKGGPVRRTDNLTTFMCRFSGILKLLEPSGPVQACNGIALPLPRHLGTELFGSCQQILQQICSMSADFSYKRMRTVTMLIKLLSSTKVWQNIWNTF